MIIVLKPGSTDADIEDVSRRVREHGLQDPPLRGEVRTIIGAVGDDRGKEQLLALQSLECVESVVRILQPFKLASREVQPDDTQFKVHGVPDRRHAARRHGRALLRRVAAQIMAVAEGVKAGGRPRSCAAAPSSRAPRPTPSRGSRRRG